MLLINSWDVPVTLLHCLEGIQNKWWMGKKRWNATNKTTKLIDGWKDYNNILIKGSISKYLLGYLNHWYTVSNPYCSSHWWNTSVPEHQSCKFSLIDMFLFQWSSENIHRNINIKMLSERNDTLTDLISHLLNSWNHKLWRLPVLASDSQIIQYSSQDLLCGLESCIFPKFLFSQLLILIPQLLH